MPRLKITKANIAQIVKPGSGQVDYFDTDLRGFGVRATKEALTFFVRSTLRGTTKKPFIPIGTYGTFSPEQARTTAKEYLRRLDMGENPHPKAQPKREIITIQDLYSQYISGKKTGSRQSHFQLQTISELLISAGFFSSRRVACTHVISS